MAQNKGKSRLYPAVSMADAFELCEKAGKFPSKKPIAYSTIAEEYGINNPNTKSLKYKISSAKQLGLINTSGNTFSLTDWGAIVAHPASDKEIKDIRKKCFKEPPLYKELIERYEGKSLPDQVSLENLLVREYGIMESVKTTAANVFLEMIREAEVGVAGVLTFEISEQVTDNSEAIKEKKDNLPEEQITRSEKSHLSPSIDMNDNGYEPLVVPLGQQRKAMLYMPSDATKEDADYVKAMIDIMFNRLYA